MTLPAETNAGGEDLRKTHSSERWLDQGARFIEKIKEDTPVPLVEEMESH